MDKVRDRKMARIHAEEQETVNTYQQLLEFCEKHGIKLKRLANHEAAKIQRKMLIESLCLNVNNSYLSYKSSGNMDKALVKVKLVPEPNKVHIETPLEELVEAENKAIAELRVQRREMAERVKRFTERGSPVPSPPTTYMFKVLPTLRHSVDAIRADTTDSFLNH